MKKNSILVKTLLMSMLTAGSIFSFTSCADDIEIDKAPEAPDTEMTCKTRSIDTDEYYNINNEQKHSFNRYNWDKSNGIFLRLSKPTTSTAETKDSLGRSGYQHVFLPWAEGSSPVSNLPKGLTKGLNRDNGWELVANFCGSYKHTDANYIILYNKYLGKARYFYYIPENSINNGATDHNFEIQMEDLMAQHSVFGYALPTKMRYQSASSVKANQGGYWTQYVTPWTNSSDDLGKQIPKAGWSAFDVDLSVYRGEDNFLTKDDIIKTSIIGYKTQNVDLFAQMKGDIQGDMKLEKCCVSTSSGAFGPVDDLINTAKGIKDFVSGAKDAYQSLISGDILGAYEGGVNLAKQACDLVGIDYGAETTGFDGYKGEVNMKLNGTIDMAGKISSRCDVQGLSCLNQSLQNYELKNSTFGQGVWNIEDAPVVYVTDGGVVWANPGVRSSSSYVLRKKGVSPFNGSGYAGEFLQELQFNDTPNGYDPCHGRVCYFDPSSIKVQLNKNVFTEAEISSARVYAVCGVRKNMKYGSTDMYRKAMGLGGSEVSKDGRKDFINCPYDAAPFDALSGHKDMKGMKKGVKFGVENISHGKLSLFGTGDDDYLIEPIALRGGDGSDLLPAYEVTVTLIVNHKGQPIVYSRTYLPKFVKMDIANMPSKNEMLKKRHALYDQNIYNQQIAHYEQLYNWAHRTFVAEHGTFADKVMRRKNGKRLFTTKGVSETEIYPAALDGDPSTRWVAHIETREYHTTERDYVWACSVMEKGNPWSGKPCWFMEFHTNAPSNPTSYSLISSNDAAKFPQCNPRVFGLWGRKSPNDNWTLLAFSSYNNQPQDMLPRENSKASGKIPFRFHDAKGMRYYRFEVLDVADAHLMRLGDIRFNYD